MEETKDKDLLNLAVSLSEKYKITIKYSDERVTSLVLINGMFMADTSPVGRSSNVGEAAYDTTTKLIGYIKKAEKEAKENAR